MRASGLGSDYSGGKHSLKYDADIHISETDASCVNTGGSDFEGLDPRALGPSADQEANLGVDAESNSDEEDAELARLLESASGMAGRPNQISNGRKRQRIADLDEEEEDDGADYFYAEFFGPGGVSLFCLWIPFFVSLLVLQRELLSVEPCI